MGFLQQPVVIAILTYLAIGFVLLGGIIALMRSMRQRDKDRKRAAVEGLAPRVEPLSEVTEDDDFDIFMSTTNDDDYDPLADLYQASADDEEDSVDLSSLLATMGEEPVHTVASDTVNVNLPSGETAQARELLSILRDESDGRLMVLSGDTAYRSLLDDPDVKKEFTKIMKELSAIILKPDDAVKKPAATTKPKPTTPAQKPASPVVDKPVAKQKVEAKPLTAQDVEPRSLEEEVEEMIEQAKNHSDDYIPGDLPDFTLPDNPDNYKQGRYGWVSVEKVDKAPELNIADAIEKYLQYKIGTDPKFQRRGIHIKPAVSGGVRIEADGKSYDFVDEIKDAEVRDFIQTAISEWQDRH